MNILCIGDPHYNLKNRQRCLEFSRRCLDKIKQLKNDNKLDLIICLGDIFHTHERSHMLECKDVVDFLNSCQILCKTILIVGNHDRLNNKVYCTNEHFLYMYNETIKHIKLMNPTKQIQDNLIIVDKPMIYNKLALIPYVEAGRFKEALNDLKGTFKYIFCHQEFKGCKMNNITSTKGDTLVSANYVIFSGHIHDKQTIKHMNNIIHYVGTPFQQRFGEDPNKTICLLTITSSGYSIEEIDLGLPKLVTKELTVGEVRNCIDIDRHTRLIIKGKEVELNVFKKSKIYKQLKKKGVKFSFKLIREEIIEIKTDTKFIDQFLKIISTNKDAIDLFNELNF